MKHTGWFRGMCVGGECLFRLATWAALTSVSGLSNGAYRLFWGHVCGLRLLWWDGGSDKRECADVWSTLAGLGACVWVATVLWQRGVGSTILSVLVNVAHRLVWGHVRWWRLFCSECRVGSEAYSGFGSVFPPPHVRAN